MLYAACLRVNAVIVRALRVGLSALAETNFLRSDLASLLEHHLMELVPVVEIV
jgi:hypothetical protein